MLVHKFIFMEGRKALLSDDKHFPRLLKSDTNVAVNVDAVIILPAERMGLGGRDSCALSVLEMKISELT